MHFSGEEYNHAGRNSRKNQEGFKGIGVWLVCVWVSMDSYRSNEEVVMKHELSPVHDCGDRVWAGCTCGEVFETTEPDKLLQVREIVACFDNHLEKVHCSHYYVEASSKWECGKKTVRQVCIRCRNEKEEQDFTTRCSQWMITDDSNSDRAMAELKRQINYIAKSMKRYLMTNDIDEERQDEL